jgi:crotonobetainyl-CoA:carnitine CoA-transferase CaiB-like acyl-CoA transferase
VIVNDLEQDLPLPLTGIKVVDLTSNIAGPYCSAILADLGAEVVHVEGPRGDDSRRMAPVRGQESAYFAVVNRNKFTMQLDITNQDDLGSLIRLIERSDVFVTNLRAHKLGRRGLDASSLRRSHPRLVHAALSAYGHCGPDSERPGYDAVIQARTGIASITGHADSPPARAGVSILDFGSGMWLALAVVSALRRRDVTGLGADLTCSLYETGVTWVSYHLAAHQLTGQPSRRFGSGHPAFAPYGIFQTARGQLCIGIGSDQQFHVLCQTLGLGDLADDPAFAVNSQRVRNAEALQVILESALASASAHEWSEALTAAGLPVDILQQPEDVLWDNQAEAISILGEVHVQAEPIRIPGLPIRFDGIRPAIRPSSGLPANAPDWVFE